MANPEHVVMVRGGFQVVEQWREENPSMVLDLSEADLCRADLTAVDLSGCNLREANLQWANLFGTNLREANLRLVKFFGARLCLVSLVGADLRGASLEEAHLSQVSVRGANLTGSLCMGTAFCDMDLSDAIGLEDIRHFTPSSVGVDTLFKSKGKIPRDFLRNAGVPEKLIEYFSSLTGAALRFYTSVISFTDADDPFSGRLYQDLQAAGIRCWRWKENAKWGRTLMAEVDTAIREYDKLVVILSKDSLQSEPVIREIERALQKEQRENKEVLFPIRLDDAVFEWQHELRADVVRKVIGDLREWQDPTKYDVALNRLIADLRAEAKSV